ncbi:MAG: subclass B3 metallo-beta-lactamase [Xanthomonadales bacterium]|nr:subclass B3 metallo-beta-lactamase [Xanthomonadales bacterium]
MARLPALAALTVATLALVAGTARAASPAPPAPDAPMDCRACAAWNAPQAPFRIHGDTWYVGPRGLSVLLIDTGAGLVLLDGALPQSAPQVLDNLRSLGFDPAQVRWVVNSHAHFDHAGGIAALAAATGARVAASPQGARALALGDALSGDPQADPTGGSMRFPAVAGAHGLADGESIRLGRLRLTAHHTPGHTPGGTTWSWRSCEGAHCLDLVYADSLTAVSAPDFRFGADPRALAAFRASIDKVAGLPCDLLVTAHPEASDLFGRQTAGTLADASSCQRLGERSRRALDDRLQREAGD